MTSENLKLILQYIVDESMKPLGSYNYETRLYTKGYRKAMITIKEFITECCSDKS